MCNSVTGTGALNDNAGVPTPTRKTVLRRLSSFLRFRRTLLDNELCLSLILTPKFRPRFVQRCIR